MASSNDHKKTFQTIITKFGWWSRLGGSQFVEMISTFVGQMVAKSIVVSERSLQEAFLSTASKRPSILAAAEDKGYIGRKISPSVGTIQITNKTNQLFSVPRDSPLISNAAVEYIAVSAIEIPPFGVVQLPASQLVLKTFKSIVAQEYKFLEVILPKSVTAKTHKIDVYVSPPNGGAELWTKSYMYRRTEATDKAYTEFYKPTEQLGIRFGNGINGKIPSTGSEITLKVWTTEGDTTLINDQTLEFTGAMASLNDMVEIKTLTPIVGGAKAESDEETRAGALYVTPFDNQIVWDDDYSHYIKQNIANIIWVKAWGEQEQEKQDGISNLDNVNKIFISAFSLTQEQDVLGVMITDLLSDTNYLNKRYQYVVANPRAFTITLSGTSTGDKDLVQVRKVVKEAINSVYGLKPKNERPKVILEKDVNELVRKLNVFYDFSIGWENFPTDIDLQDYIYIDVETSPINIKYLGA